MTAVAEAPAAEQTKPEDTKADASAEGDKSKGRARDFTKFRPSHQELADFINQHEEWKTAGLGDVTPNQVKAVLALRSDFNDTPEQKEAREARKRELAEEKKQFEGMTPEQIKNEKAARRAEKQAEKLEQQIREAREKAEALRSGKAATGEDLAAAVEANQAAEASGDAPKRTLGRKKTSA